jgi:hypothetical protein
MQRRSGSLIERDSVGAGDQMSLDSVSSSLGHSQQRPGMGHVDVQL